jgi:hypothetical protein
MSNWINDVNFQKIGRSGICIIQSLFFAHQPFGRIFARHLDLDLLFLAIFDPSNLLENTFLAAGEKKNSAREIFSADVTIFLVFLQKHWIEFSSRAKFGNGTKLMKIEMEKASKCWIVN